MWAMQYWQPLARLAMWASSRLKPMSTVLPLSQMDAASWDSAATIFGLRCMIRTLFGTNPSERR